MILIGDVMEKLATLESASVDCVVTSPLNPDSIKGLGVNAKAFHFGAHLLAAMRRSDMAATFSYPALFASIFDLAKVQTILGLSPLYSQKGKQGFKCGGGTQVRNLPREKSATTRCTWSRHIKCAAKYILQKLNGLRLNLLHANSLTVRWLSRIADYAHRVGIAFYPDCSIGVDDPCKISQNLFIHKIYLPHRDEQWK